MIGLGSDCTVKRLTEVSFSGDDKLPSDWVSQTDQDNRKIIIDPQVESLGDVERTHDVAGSIKESIVDVKTQEILIENTF